VLPTSPGDAGLNTPLNVAVVAVTAPAGSVLGASGPAANAEAGATMNARDAKTEAHKENRAGLESGSKDRDGFTRIKPEDRDCSMQAGDRDGLIEVRQEDRRLATKPVFDFEATFVLWSVGITGSPWLS
jgi:hypothetical protein